MLEFIIPLVTQLQKLGVQLDGSYNTQKVLSKFAPRTQRKVLEKIMTSDMEEHHWKMMEVLDALDALITTEERIDSLVNHDGIYTPRKPLERCIYQRRISHKFTLSVLQLDRSQVSSLSQV